MTLVEALLLRAARVPVLATPVTGFAASLATGVAAAKLRQWVVVKRPMLPFAVYCGLLGVATIAVGIFHG